MSQLELFKKEKIITKEDVKKIKEKAIERKKEEEKLNIQDYYFWDMRMWEKPFDLDNEVTAILERNHTNNSGNGCYQIRRLNNKEEAIKYLKPLMITGISNMCVSWKKELRGSYLETYGEKDFKEIYTSYLQLSKWLEENKQRGKTETYEYFLEKAETEIRDKLEKEINEKRTELMDLIKRYKK